MSHEQIELPWKWRRSLLQNILREPEYPERA